MVKNFNIECNLNEGNVSKVMNTELQWNPWAKFSNLQGEGKLVLQEIRNVKLQCSAK